jgi:hypothetical protein
MHDMSTTRPVSRRQATRSTSSSAQPQQLSLLAPTNVPLQFRLDERTRRRGLAHIALIRQQLAEMHAAKADTTREIAGLGGAAVRQQAA